MSDPLIWSKSVTLKKDNQTILSQVDFECHPHEIVTLIGPNGAGKSSLIKVLLGLQPPSSGRVGRKKGLVIGYAPQNVQIDASLPMTVERFLRCVPKVSKAQCETALKEVGAHVVIDQSLMTLSGGQWQRVLIARALLRNPQLLVLDEPAQGVDIAGQAQLYELIADLNHQRGCAVLLVSHDLHVVMAQTNRVLCLNQHVCCDGQPSSVLADPSFIEVFGSQAAKSFALYPHSHNHDHDIDGNIIHKEL
ncbi:MAG: zinc ABC transporter ATP-binding protein [Legionellales bacterium]|nr:zinc ABC transporter ATP-binding protein [Legionellales bacterium]